MDEPNQLDRWLSAARTEEMDPKFEDDQDRELRIQLVDEWLSEQHVTLWQSWTIDDPKRRRLAAEWVVDLHEKIDSLYVQRIP